MVIIYVTLSVIRCLVCHEVVWFISLNEKVVAIVVNITSAAIAISIRVVIHLMFYGTEKFIKFPFLSGETHLCDKNEIKGRAPVFLYSLFTASLLLELYIGIKIKRLSCSRFIPVTLGHLYMIACMYVLTNYQDCSNTFLKSLSISISLQFMYVLKQKEYTIELVKKCCNLPNNIVGLVSENIELNDFGIFVGPQVISEPELEIDERDSSKEENTFGGVYVG